MLLSLAPGRRQPLAMGVARIRGYRGAGHHIERRFALRGETDEDVKEIFGHVFLSFRVQYPDGTAALTGLHLNADALRGIYVRGKDVNPARIAQRQRGHESAARQLRRYEILARHAGLNARQRLHRFVLSARVVFRISKARGVARPPPSPCSVSVSSPSLRARATAARAAAGPRRSCLATSAVGCALVSWYRCA